VGTCRHDARHLKIAFISYKIILIKLAQIRAHALADPRICKPPGGRARIFTLGLKLYVADEKSHRLAADIDPLAIKCAVQEAAAA
jgi:hypothetical protein